MEKSFWEHPAYQKWHCGKLLVLPESGVAAFIQLGRVGWNKEKIRKESDKCYSRSFWLHVKWRNSRKWYCRCFLPDRALQLALQCFCKVALCCFWKVSLCLSGKSLCTSRKSNFWMDKNLTKKRKKKKKRNEYKQKELPGKNPVYQKWCYGEVQQASNASRKWCCCLCLVGGVGWNKE